MNNVHFAIPEIYGETLSYYELLRKLVDKTNELIENYNTVPEQIAEEVKNLDAAQLFSTVLNQIIHSIATDNTKSKDAVKQYKKNDLLYATFNDTVNLYEAIKDFTNVFFTELKVDENIREVNISELLIELRNLIDTNKNNIESVTAITNKNSEEIETIHNDITDIENKNNEQDTELSTLRTMLSSPYNYKGEVSSISALPETGNVNDTYYVQDVKYKVTWTGSAWVQSSLSEADYENELSKLKVDLFNNTNSARLIPTQKDRYINTSGSTVDVTNFIGGSSAVGFNCYVVDCEYGDLFTINGNGGVNAPRLWAFVDENGNNLLHSGQSDIERDFVIIAPENSKWLVINDNSGLTSYRGEDLTKRLDTVEKDINNGTITKYIFYTKLGYYKADGVYVDNAEFVATDKITLPEKSKRYISGSAFVNGTNIAIATYFDYKNNIIGSYFGDSVMGDHTCNFTNVKIPQNAKYVAFSNSAKDGHKIYLTSSLLNEPTNRIYYVGYGQNDGDIYFDKLADCLKVAESYHGKKTINIQSGTYDVYDEFGGYEYFSTLDYTEYTWSTILPTLDNVEIIGHGKVILNFYPDNTLNGNLRWLLSCLNVRGNVYIENITINCGWCRYGIHDESDTLYPNTTHNYKNVNINMNTGDYISATGGVAFGNGYSKNSKVIMEDCNIVKGNASEVWSCHANQDCKLTFKGCIFDGNGSVSSVRISQNGDVSLYAKFENCFIENGISIRNEGNAIVDGNTQIDLFNTKVDTIENGYAVNRKPVTSYNTITGDKTVLVIPTE